MTEINIAGGVKELIVFDDPEYCEDKKTLCRRLDDSRCAAFITDDYYPEYLEVSKKTGFHEKCPQCKEAYQGAKKINYCALCGDEIEFVDNHWRHVNTNPRHIPKLKK